MQFVAEYEYASLYLSLAIYSKVITFGKISPTYLATDNGIQVIYPNITLSPCLVIILSLVSPLPSLLWMTVTTLPPKLTTNCDSKPKYDT